MIIPNILGIINFPRWLQQCRTSPTVNEGSLFSASSPGLVFVGLVMTARSIDNNSPAHACGIRWVLDFVRCVNAQPLCHMPQTNKLLNVARRRKIKR